MRHFEPAFTSQYVQRRSHGGTTHAQSFAQRSLSRQMVFPDTIRKLFPKHLGGLTDKGESRGKKLHCHHDSRFSALVNQTNQ